MSRVFTNFRALKAKAQGNYLVYVQFLRKAQELVINILVINI